MRREDLEYWNTVLGETYESDGFYTDRPRVTPLRERTQTYIDLGTGGGDFASDGKWPFAVSFAAAVSFVMSKNLMKNDVMIGLSAGKENQKGAALTGYVANLSADMQVAELKRQIAARREEALNHSETFSEALEHFEMKGNEYVPGLKTIIREDGLYPEAQDTYDADVVFYLCSEKGSVRCGFAEELYDEGTIDSIASQIRKFMACDGSARLSEVEVLSDSEIQRIKGMEHGEPHGCISGTVIDVMREHAVAYASNTAVEEGDVRLTYREFDERTNQVAQKLYSHLGVRDGYVGVYMDNCIDQAVAIVGIQKAGCAYIPIDEELPAERTRQIIEDADVSVVFCLEKNMAELLKLQQACANLREIICMDSSGYRTEELSKQPVGAVVGPEDTAYAIYTSGTTGKPKGVAVSHGALMELCSSSDIYDIDETSRSLRYVKVGFDPSVLEVFPFWMRGAAVVNMPGELRTDLDGLSDFMREKRITHVTLPTQVCEQMQGYDNEFLKVMITGGDKLKAFRKTSPYRLLNNYGPTENTVSTTIFEVDRGYKSIPIGRPFGNTAVYIVDQYGRRQAEGVPGELWIGGGRLAEGYINNRELTDSVFFSSDLLEEKRVYRSGDIARWLPDGNLDFAGRIDNQVKISAFRIETEEVEAVMSAIGGVESTVVSAISGNDGQKALCAYYTGNPELSEAWLRDELKRTLPPYMIPKYFVHLQEIPLTLNGKIDYRKLPVPGIRASELLKPENEREEKMWRLWRDVLGTDKFGVTDDFFQAGGNSIQAMRLISEWNRSGEPAIAFSEMTAEPSVRAMCMKIAERAHNDETPEGDERRVPALDLKERYEPFNLSQMQQAYFVGRRGEMHLGQVPTHSYIEFTCEDYDSSRFLCAVKKLMERHDMLHARFLEDGRQFVMEHYDVRIDEEDLSSLPQEEQQRRVEEIRREMSGMARDCFRESLVTVRVSLLGGERALIHFYSDGLIIDGWSLELLMRDMEYFYEDIARDMPDTPLLFRNYVEFMESRRHTAEYRKSEAFWLKKIPELPEAPALPMKQTGKGAETIEVCKHTGTLSKDEWNRFEAACRKFGFTSFTGLLTAFGEVVGAWSKKKDFCINVPTFNRMAAGGMADNTVGECASFFLFAMEHSRSSFIEKAERNRRELALLMEHDSYTGIDVQRKISQMKGSVGDYSIPVVFTSLLDIPAVEQKHFKKTFVMTHTSQVWIDAVAQYCNDRIEFSWDCVDNLFEDGVAENMVRAFVSRLKQLGEREEAWHEAAGLDVPEAREAAERINNVRMDLGNMTLGQLLAEGRRKFGSRIAAVQGNDALTYDMFYDLVRGHAAEMKRAGVKPGDVVAIAIEKSFDQLAATVAAVMTGAVYLPLDVHLNEERIRYCIEEAGSKAAVFDSDTKHLMKNISENVRSYNADEATPPDGGCELHVESRTMDDLFCIIYTSGSTGRPKGVMIQQRGLINALLYTNRYYDVTEDDKVLTVTNLSHDMSMYDLFGMLIAGGCIVLPDKRDVKNPKHWIELINRHGVSIWNSAPALMEMMLEIMSLENISGLQTVRLAIMGGDVMRKTVPASLWKHNPDMKVVNVGGPTETTLWNIHHEVTREDLERNRIPYGLPMANTKYYILNEILEICPVYTEGIMYVEGVGVTRGYLNDEEQTAAKYITNPYTGNRMYCTGDVGRYLESGEIDIIGRDDLQIKINGKRIELEEIEQVVYENKDIAFAAAVLLREENAISLYCRCISDIREEDVRKELEKKLPDYMLPKYITFIESVPLSRNGKVDRKALAQIRISNAAAEVTRDDEYVTDGERKLIALYNRVIGTQRTMPESNFFSLGGDSLKAIKLLYEVNSEFNTALTLTDIFNNPSVRGLASYIQTISEEDMDKLTIRKCQDTGGIPLGLAQEGIWFVNRSVEDQDCGQRYNLVGSMEIGASLDVENFAEAINKTVDCCRGLRAEIYEDDYRPYQRTVDELTIDLTCEDRSGESAEDVRRSFEDEEMRRRYVLEKAPLFNFRLGRAEEGIYVFTMGIHHILVDAYSVNLILRKIKEIYFDLEEGRNREYAEDVSFQDFASWQTDAYRDGLFDGDIDYWKEKLAGELTRIELSETELSTWDHFEGGVCDLPLDADELSRLKELCSNMEMTVFAGLTTIYYMFLAWLCGADDICLGSASSGRVRSEIRSTVGNFANVLLLRTTVRPDDSFSSLARRVKETMDGAYAHQSLPFEKVAERACLSYEYRDLPYKLLIDYIDLEDDSRRGIFGDFEYTRQLSAADLDLFIQSVNDEFQFQFYYKKRLFAEDEIEEFAGLIQDILSAAVEAPDKPWNDYDL
ncbi:amino acid adenylation domain-containing protein [Gallibacter sp. Marseille-QA0791]|uniref:amino acid adenylation domain-containing protein n=1 Tax=Gallibacter sp. Marseille-QA0791 TaxID=3378781 RepID=UPI003D0AD19F